VELWLRQGKKVLNSDAYIFQIPFRRSFVQVDYPFGFGEWQGPQKESIENAENCCVACDAQSEHANYHQAEGWLGSHVTKSHS